VPKERYFQKMCRTKKVKNVSTEEKNSVQAFLGAVESS